MSGSQQLSERELVAKLVRDQHLSVPERNSLPDGKARGSLVRETVEQIVEQVGHFPPHAKSGSAYDGGILEEVGEGDYVIHWQAEVGLYRFATISKDRFLSLRAAARSFCRREWPVDIDGVPIDWKT